MKLTNNENLMNWLMPRAIDWIALVLYLGCITIYTYLALTGHLEASAWLTIGAVFVGISLLITIDRVEYHRFGEQLPVKIAGSFLLLRLAIIIGFGFSDGLGFQEWQSFIAISVMFFMFFIIGQSYGLSGQAWTMYLLGRFRPETDSPPSDEGTTLLFIVIMSVMLLFVFSIAYLVRRERSARQESEQLLAELETSHQRLQNYAEKVSELATTEERNRLAREIHDSLGHYMTVINVQLEKAIAFRDRAPDEADQAIQDAKYLASEALNDIRRSVSTLRSVPEPFMFVQSVRSLVRNMEGNGFTIELNIQGDAAGYSDQSLQTLYRAVQEGLTNIQKHAKANHVTITVDLQDQMADLTIVDDGEGFDPIKVKNVGGGHYGLQGVRERLELIRGSLNLESAPQQGTRLMITVPKNPLVLVTN